MRRFLLRLAWLAIFLCVPVRTAALEAAAEAPLKVQAVFEAQLPLLECSLMRTGSQTVPMTGHGALNRASKHTNRGWKRRAATQKHGPRLRVCWKGGADG